ncbi:hypothetical protein ATANTOWER_020225 [Ataeniobius toweri]|uniref:Uncharacterized protein n=1 Tax=Ataeniobius toweri TaxID=208326 RepID=A0ABU7BJR4_9TELE|nr:hypothetical protein [Ataeniobius toweri]
MLGHRILSDWKWRLCSRGISQAWIRDNQHVTTLQMLFPANVCPLNKSFRMLTYTVHTRHRRLMVRILIFIFALLISNVSEFQLYVPPVAAIDILPDNNVVDLL